MSTLIEEAKTVTDSEFLLMLAAAYERLNRDKGGDLYIATRLREIAKWC